MSDLAKRLNLRETEYIVAKWQLFKQATFEKIEFEDELYLTNHRLLFEIEEVRIPLESIKMVSLKRNLIRDDGLEIITDQNRFYKEFHLTEGTTGMELMVEKIKEQIGERVRDLKAGKMFTALDFSFLRTLADKGGIILTTLKCPNCTAPIQIPQNGTQTICSHCGNAIYVQDVFEKLKKLLE